MFLLYFRSFRSVKFEMEREDAASACEMMRFVKRKMKSLDQYQCDVNVISS